MTALNNLERVDFRLTGAWRLVGLLAALACMTLHAWFLIVWVFQWFHYHVPFLKDSALAQVVFYYFWTVVIIQGGLAWAKPGVRLAALAGSLAPWALVILLTLLSLLDDPLGAVQAIAVPAGLAFSVVAIEVWRAAPRKSVLQYPA